MQNNPYLFYSCHQENYRSHHFHSASNDSATGTGITSISAHTRVPVNDYEWPSAIVPVIGNGDSLLTASSDATENHLCAARASFHQAVWDSTLPISLTSCHDFDAHLESLLSIADVKSTHGYAGWNESNMTVGMQLDGNQAPSGTTDPNLFGRTWSHRGDDGHAVGTPAQPPFQRDTDYHSCQIPTWPTVASFPEHGANCHSVPTNFAGVGSWMAQSAFNQVSSLTRHRRHIRRTHAHPERVICDKCHKPMRRQSLKRHVREVHDRIKRHVKPGFATEP